MIHDQRIHFAAGDTYLRHFPNGMTPAEAACLALLDRVEALEARLRQIESRTNWPVLPAPRLHLSWSEDMKEDDPFKPLSAKVNPTSYSVGGRLIEKPTIARASEDRRIMAAIRRKQVHRQKAGEGK